MMCIQCVLLLILVLSFVPCLVEPGDAEGFWFFLGVLLPPPVSPVPRGLSRLKSLGSHLPQVLFCDFSVLCLRTTDCLVLLLH